MKLKLNVNKPRIGYKELNILTIISRLKERYGVGTIDCILSLNTTQDQNDIMLPYSFAAIFSWD